MVSSNAGAAAADHATTVCPRRFSIALHRSTRSLPADEFAAIEAARLFTDYLQARRKEHQTLSMIGPGRFLMPGDLPARRR
jgi:predicted YcjX-like family ATPase